MSKLESGLNKLQKTDYDSIDKLMTRIAKDSNITGKELHNNFVKKHGKIAVDAMNAHSSPIKKLESFLTVANQAVGPRFERFTLSLSSLNSSKPMVDYHEQYISDLIKNLLDEARIKNEIKEIDTQATALLLGGLGRYFQSKKLLKDLHQTPEKTSNFLTKIIIDGIKMEKS